MKKGLLSSLLLVQWILVHDLQILWKKNPEAKKMVSILTYRKE